MDPFMAEAFRLAKKADPFPNPRVGAVLIKDNKIIGSGFHRKAGEPHAEVEAIEEAIRLSGNSRIAKGATLYVTLEPCSHKNKRTPPCTDYIIRKGISKVVYAVKDPNPLVDGASFLANAGIEVIGPTHPKEGIKLIKKWLQKPFVAIKMAMSADGKTATRTGDSKWISSEASRTFVHRMRAEFDAIIVGAGTVIADDPQLTAHNQGKDPFRVIVDGKLKVPTQSKIFKQGGKVFVAAQNLPRKISRFEKATGAQVIISGENHVDIAFLIDFLGKMGFKKILIEGGSELNAQALEAGVVDEIYLFVAPKLIGGREAKGVIGGQGIKDMNQAIPLRLKRVKKIGNDLFLTFFIKKT